MLGRVLTKHGYNVALASSGREALQKIATKTLDLIIMDLNLPDIGGLELDKLIRSRNPATKRIILTGMAPENNGGNREETPKILIKPLTAEELISAVEEILNGK